MQGSGREEKQCMRKVNKEPNDKNIKYKKIKKERLKKLKKINITNPRRFFSNISNIKRGYKSD